MMKRFGMAGMGKKGKKGKRRRPGRHAAACRPAACPDLEELDQRAGGVHAGRFRR